MIQVSNSYTIYGFFLLVQRFFFFFYFKCTFGKFLDHFFLIFYLKQNQITNIKGLYYIFLVGFLISMLIHYLTTKLYKWRCPKKKSFVFQYSQKFDNIVSTLIQMVSNFLWLYYGRILINIIWSPCFWWYGLCTYVPSDYYSWFL